MARIKMGELRPSEKEFLTEVLYAREAALAWNFNEAGMHRQNNQIYYNKK